jgi:hypothetical protein
MICPYNFIYVFLFCAWCINYLNWSILTATNDKLFDHNYWSNNYIWRKIVVFFIECSLRFLLILMLSNRLIIWNLHFFINNFSFIVILKLIDWFINLNCFSLLSIILLNLKIITLWSLPLWFFNLRFFIF